MTIHNTRSLLYHLARFLGDVQAVKRGPTATVKRIERRLVGRGMGRLMRKIIK